MKKAKSSFKGKVGKASERKAKEAFSYGYLQLPSGVSVFLPEPGKSITLDFFPYEVTMKNHPDRDDDDEIALPGELWYRLPFKAHRNVGSKSDSVVCLQSFGKRCPICEYKIKRGKEGADKDELIGLKASDRYLYVVNPLDSGKYEAGKPHVFDISHAMFQKLLDDELKEESVPEDFMDLADGVSLKVRFASKTIGSSKPFAEATKITVVERKKAYKESILDQVPKLDELLHVLTYDELEAKFFELDTETDDDDDEPKTIRGKKSTKPSKVVEEEDEDEDEEEDEDEAPPKRSSKSAKKEEAPSRGKKKPEPIEEEEEDEDEEEEEEDEMTWDTLTAMKEKELLKFIDLKELEVDPDEFEHDVKGLRKAIATELGIKVPKATAPAKEEKELPPKDKRCIACGGTGKSSKGGVCVPCHGTGVKQKPKPVEEEEEAPKKSKKAKECPSGYRFGVDTDKKDECDSCDIWEACMEAKKANKK